MSPSYWLFKSEPNAYSFDDLLRDGVAEWDGVRNFQARNYLRDEIKEGDGVLFYHSGEHTAVIGTAAVVRSGYPDHTAWDPTSDHPDPKSTPDSPVWYMVDIEAKERFARPVTLSAIKGMPQLADMMLVRRGMRLSIQPVTPQEWEAIRQLGAA